ncbi:MAG: deoxyribonuclease V [Armatimonadota bacterium]
MDLNTLHPWDVSLEEATRLQRELRERLVLEAPAGFAPQVAAGADVSTTKTSDAVYAGFVVLELEHMTAVAQATAVSEAAFPYVPGYLSFRELPALAEAWRRLEARPDVLILDGHGTAHPRRMGVACHAGLVFGVPTVGCAKSILVGTHDPLPPERGATAPLVHRGEVVGMAVRTRTNVSPVYVSPGNQIDLATAVELILRLTPDGKYRLPETTRRAHGLVNALRREME